MRTTIARSTTRAEDCEKPAIVYVATRKHAEDVCQWLRDKQIRAAFYHGGMKKAARKSV